MEPQKNNLDTETLDLIIRQLRGIKLPEDYVEMVMIANGFPTCSTSVEPSFLKVEEIDFYRNLGLVEWSVACQNLTQAVNSQINFHSGQVKIGQAVSRIKTDKLIYFITSII